MQVLSHRRLAILTLAASAPVLAWDLSGLDMPMAHWFGNAAGFPLQDAWFLVRVLHDGLRYLAWAFALWLCLGVWFPGGWLRLLGIRRRLQLASSVLVAAALVGLAKAMSRTSCPWSLADFGGIARYVSHWSSLVVADGGGSGGCFPAGQAAVGFAFVGGYFAFRHEAPVLARCWLIVSLSTGLLVGLSQQARGAHFMSHTLWTGWLCWCTAWAIDGLMQRVSLARVSADLGEVA